MKNSKGEILEDIMESEPMTYLHGSGRMLHALEENLEGLKAGDEKIFLISKEHGYDVDDSFSFEVVIEEVRPATEEELKVGQILQTYKEECGQDCNCR
jgi:FKBP-type peptidyl-prolyl cis-trans isomerase SlyD